MRIAIIMGGVNPGHTRDVTSLIREEGSVEVSYIDLGCSNLDDLELYNIVVVHTSLESASEAQLFRLSSYLEGKHRILFLIHEAAIYNRQYIFFNKVMCVRFKNHWKYKKITIQKESSHSLLNGIESVFQTDDELYFFDEDKRKIIQDTNVLLSELTTGTPVFFEKIIKENKSFLYYISIGHDDRTLGNHNFRLLIRNLVCFARSI